MNVEIDDEIYEVLELRAEEKDFDQTQEYITHLLQQIVQKIKAEKEQESEDSYSKEQEEKVKEKLEDLGYMG